MDMEDARISSRVLELKKTDEIVQTKAFSRWWQYHVGMAAHQQYGRQSHRSSQAQILLFEEIKSGVTLVELIESLQYPAKIPFKVHESPRSCFEKLENLRNCLQHLQSSGVKLVNISPEDLLAGKKDLVLGLTWSLLLKYGAADGMRQAELAAWARSVAAGISMTFAKRTGHGFWEQGFRDGRILMAMVVGMRGTNVDQSVVDLSDAGTETAQISRLRAAFRAALRRGVVRLLDAEDVAEGKADAQSVIAYISLLSKAVGDTGEAVLLQRIVRGRAGRRRAKLLYEQMSAAATKMEIQSSEMSEPTETSPSAMEIDAASQSQVLLTDLSNASTRCGSPVDDVLIAEETNGLAGTSSAIPIAYPRVWDFKPANDLDYPRVWDFRRRSIDAIVAWGLRSGTWA